MVGMTIVDGMTLVEFLEARIAEDEAEAHKAAIDRWGARAVDELEWVSNLLSAERDSTEDQDEHARKWWPTRVLAECAAKRAVIGWWTNGVIGYVEVGGALTNPLLPLAAVYKDHPDYRQEWAI